MDDSIKGYKLLLNYEVKEDVVNDYYQFVMGEYLPALQSHGLQMSDAWQTAYGNAPSRMIGFVCADNETLNELIASDLWETLTDRLNEYVTDFEFKVIPYRGGFQF